VKGNGGAAAMTHADLNGDGKQDLVAITYSGYVQVYDVKNQTLIFSSTGLGGGTDVAVADLDGDGTQEIVALASSQVVVFGTASGGGYIQKAQYSMTNGGSGLLVADTNGDSKPEIYVLGGGSGSYGTMAVTQFDRTLTPVMTFPVANSALSIHLEQSAFARKNLVIGTTGDQYSTGTSEHLEIIDPANGNLVWKSPELEGYVGKHSLSFYDLHNTGNLQLVLGTSLGMLVTQ
jgi:VCBS repeat protein